MTVQVSIIDITHFLKYNSKSSDEIMEMVMLMQMIMLIGLL